MSTKKELEQKLKLTDEKTLVQEIILIEQSIPSRYSMLMVD